jgi:hypothetical protein
MQISLYLRTMQILRHYIKIAALLIAASFTVAGHAQNNINSYKYVLVPKKFDFVGEEDEYGLNSTTKTVLEQKGFVVFWNNGSLPPDLAANRCSALFVEVTRRKAFLSTNLTFSLKDCSGNIVFKSKEGKSTEKEWYVAYDQALRNALSSLNSVPYKYDSTLPAQPQQLPATPATTPGTIPATPTQAPVSTASASSSQQPVSTASASSPQTPVPAPPAAADMTGTLYAQPMPSGYQLIDTTPKKVLTLLKTSLQDCFLAETVAGASNGIVFKKNGEWFFEYYKDGTLVSQKLAIKF